LPQVAATAILIPASPSQSPTHASSGEDQGRTSTTVNGGKSEELTLQPSLLKRVGAGAGLGYMGGTLKTAPRGPFFTTTSTGGLFPTPRPGATIP